LHRLVDAGNSVLVIEHNLDVIRSADHVIDLGPEGGPAGGELLIAGTPAEVAACKRSHTGRYLARVLGSAGAKSADREKSAGAKSAARRSASGTENGAAKSAERRKTKAAGSGGKSRAARATADRS
jgi:excinuclease ABC subunit A